MLTDKAVRVAASRDKAYKLADNRGLHLHVSASGYKSWRYKYRFENKERLLTLGAYPEVSLANAREKRDEAKKILREGRDPKHSAKRSRLIGQSVLARSFEEVDREWHASRVARWTPVHAADVIIRLKREALPRLRAMPPVEIDKPLLLRFSARSKSAARSRQRVGSSSAWRQYTASPMPKALSSRTRLMILTTRSHHCRALSDILPSLPASTGAIRAQADQRERDRLSL